MTNWEQGELPPVGEECYVLNSKLGKPDWEKCVVLFKGKHIIVYDSESCSERTGQISGCQFKPLKSPAEIEQEELESEIKLVLKVKTDNLASTLAYNLYDSGYRKFGPEITGIQT